MKTLLLIGAVQLLTFLSFSQCDIIYVTTSGTPSATGEIGDPLDIQTAITTANAGDLIRLGTGVYDLSTSLYILNNDIILEGGFDDLNSWTKTSLAGATTINRLAVNPEGTMGDYRLVALYANGISGLEIHDITFSTSNAVDPGTSTYGMHLDACSDYSLIRCQVLPGNASAGTNGATGTPGATGSNGGNGSNGAIDGNGSGGAGGIGGAGGGIGAGLQTAGGINPSGNGNTGGAGTSGNASTNLRAGGSGGAGGAGGETDHNGGAGGSGGGVNLGANQTGGGGAGTWGDPGGDGADGANGTNGTSGGNGLVGSAGQLTTFYVTGAAGTSGTDGTGGRGGIGGGGGGGQSCFFCVDGSGDGGGGGGGGGQGGQAGAGGTGGGSSFGLYLYNNGLNGIIQDCYIMAGTFGNGGNGGAGGAGGAGGIKGNGSTYGTSEVGEGGDGGNGGAGGNGGNGGAGMNGISESIQLTSGDTLAINDSSFDLAGMPEIQVTYATCTNANMTFTNIFAPLGTGTTSWFLGGFATVQFGAINPLMSAFTTTGKHDVLESAFTYTDFINITCSVDASMTHSNGVFTANTAGATYQWINCTTGMEIVGETNQTYSATVAGNYAVIVNNHGCIDTSVCLTTSFLSLDELSSNEFNIYPNPVSDVMTINFKEATSGEIRIYDVTLKLIDVITVSEQTLIEYSLNVPSGVYSIEFINDSSRTIRRVVKL